MPPVGPCRTPVKHHMQTPLTNAPTCQFAQLRQILDEKEKDWLLALKEIEAEKLSQNNTQLERLTWFRNEVRAHFVAHIGRTEQANQMLSTTHLTG